MKQFKKIALFALLLFLGQNVLAANGVIPGVGVVVKRNPGSGASKTITGKDGNFSLELTQGSYLVSLNKEQLLVVGQQLATSQNPKSKYVFNGDGTQLIITENENIIMSRLSDNPGEDLMLITVKQNTILQGTLQWDDSVMETPKPTANNSTGIGHVTLLRRNASSLSTQVFCPTGTVGVGGKCVPVKELENSADYVGHLTLLRKNEKALITRNNNGVCPEGFVLKDGICVQSLTNTSESQTKTESVPVRGATWKNTSESQAKTEGGPIGGVVIKGGQNAIRTDATEGQPVHGQIVKGAGGRSDKLIFKCPCCSEEYKSNDDLLNHKCLNACGVMKVSNSGTVKDAELAVFSNGRTTKGGIPEVIGKIIYGKIIGIKNPARVKIAQEESSDIGTATTDEEGRFRVQVSHDTVHTIYINDFEYGKIKIVDNDLSASQTGGKLINAFNYEDDFTIDNPELTAVLGVKSFAIRKGVYKVDRRNPDQGGKIVFPIVRPIPVNKEMKTDGQLFRGINPKGVDCKTAGSSCFYVSENNDANTLQEFVMIPVIEKGMCTKIEISYRGSGSPKQQGF